MRHPRVKGVLSFLLLCGCISVDTYPTPNIVDVNTVIDFLFRFSRYQDRCLKDRGHYDATDHPSWSDPSLLSGYEAVRRRNYSCSFRAEGKSYSVTCNPGASSSNRISLYIDESATIRVDPSRPAGPQSGIYRGKRPAE